MSDNEPVYKQDVYLALCAAIVRLGKNDPDACRRSIHRAEIMLDRWLIDRPEKAERYYAVDPRGTRCGKLSGYATHDDAQAYAVIVWEELYELDLSNPATRKQFEQESVEEAA